MGDMIFLISQHKNAETNATLCQYSVNFQKANKTIRLIISQSELQVHSIFLLSQRPTHPNQKKKKKPHLKPRTQSEAIACSHVLREDLITNLAQTSVSSQRLRGVRRDLERKLLNLFQEALPLSWLGGHIRSLVKAILLRYQHVFSHKVCYEKNHMKDNILKLYLIIFNFIPAPLNLLQKIVLFGFLDPIATCVCAQGVASPTYQAMLQEQAGCPKVNPILARSTWTY